MEELYTKYGKLMVELEILQGRIDQAKREINAELIKQQNAKPVVVPEVVNPA